jgi:hypothetical protein
MTEDRRGHRGALADVIGNLCVKQSLRVLTITLVFVSPLAPAADIDANTMGAISDLLSSVSADRPPPGADAATYRQAVAALKAEGLADAARPVQPGDTTLLNAYGRALLLGPRANQLREQIGQLHDAVISGQSEAIGAAIRAVYAAAGRAAPKEDAMAGLITEARNAGGDSPPTVNHVIERPGYKIAIADAVAAGQTSIEVTVNGPDGKPARVVFAGEAKTRPKSGGDGLDRRIAPKTPCTVSSAAAAALRDRLNGEWSSAGGLMTIAGSGTSISVTETNAAGRKLTYEGQYQLGKIDVRHAITHLDDIDAHLPAQVRQQLAGMGLYFTIRLETCGDPTRLTGRWGSQNVTYSPDFQVKSVHDPYDVSLALTRTGRQEEKSAEGAASGEKL